MNTNTPSKPSRVSGVLSVPKRYPLTTVVTCCALSLLSSNVRDNVAASIGKVASSLDETWRQMLHPGYLGNGKYSSPSHAHPHGKEAFLKFLTDPPSSAPELVQPGLYYHDTVNSGERFLEQ